MGCSGNGSGAIDGIPTCPNLDGGILSWLGNDTNTASCFLCKRETLFRGMVGLHFFTSIRGFDFGVILHAMSGVRVPRRGAWAFP